MRSLFNGEEANVPRWLIVLYQKVNADSITQVQEESEEYQRLLAESGNLQFCYPVLRHLLEEFGPVKLRKDEHWAFHQYLELKRKMEQLERLRLYQTGYVHCYESMRKIGALRENEDEGLYNL